MYYGRTWLDKAGHGRLSSTWQYMAVHGWTLAGHWQDIGRTLAGHWQDIGRTLAGHWQDIGRTLAGHGRT